MESDSLTFYLLYGFAFGAAMLAFAMTKMEKLRLLIVLSSAAYAVYYYAYPAEPLWLDVGSEFALIGINGFMLIFTIWSNSRIKFNQREQALYDNEFCELTRIEFSKLLLQRGGVAVSPGIGFGEYGEGFVRFGLIENEHRTRQAIRGIKRVLRQGPPAASESLSA